MAEQNDCVEIARKIAYMLRSAPIAALAALRVVNGDARGDTDGDEGKLLPGSAGNGVELLPADDRSDRASGEDLTDG
jgi:hypothetical protein